MKTPLPQSLILAASLAFTLNACSKEKPTTVTTDENQPTSAPATPNSSTQQLATFAGGCFWCTEAVFERLAGVTDVVSGYTGGTDPNPTYQKVCNPATKDDLTNHAEAVQITYDPSKISYDELLKWFWKVHDPTTLNRQGNDIGSQYRSAIYYHTDEQKKLAEASIKKIEDAKVFEDPIVTQVEKAGKFHLAEDYHQDYFAKNPGDGYCNFVLVPKLNKLFKD